MKVNYKKEWGYDGTVYTQTITIDKKYIDDFNFMVQREKETINNKMILSSADMKILYYLEELKEGKNYTSLTTLDYFIQYYKKYIYVPPKKDKDFERILWRNTIINVV